MKRYFMTKNSFVVEVTKGSGGKPLKWCDQKCFFRCMVLLMILQWILKLKENNKKHTCQQHRF